MQVDSTRVAIWSLFVSIILGITGHFAAWIVDRDDANDAAIETQIAGKIRELNKTLDLISTMRLIHSDIKKECRYFPERLHDKKFLLEAAKRRNKVGYDLVTAAGMISFYFGNEMKVAVEALNDFDASITTEQICAQSGPRDQKYWEFEKKIGQLSQKIINQDRSKI